MNMDYLISKLLEETNYAKILVSLDNFTDVDK